MPPHMISDIIHNRKSQYWELSNILISHNVIDYHSFGSTIAKNDTEYVRLHFGLNGSYQFYLTQLDASFNLIGHHNNIIYSDGLELQVENKSKRIETFGVNFESRSFIEIAQNGNDSLKRLAEKVAEKQNSLLSDVWKTNNFRIQQVIQEIIKCPFQNELKDLFLLSKSIELLVLQAEQHDTDQSPQFVKSKDDKKKLIVAKELLSSNIEKPPSIISLSKMIGISEYKLKRGFKELFGTTIFGYVHDSRMETAKQLLLDTNKSAKEIAYEIGYSSPQHFSNAFKKSFGSTPNSIRHTPNITI